MKSEENKELSKPTRREFLRLKFVQEKKEKVEEKVKMLTPEGELVEINLEVFKKAKKTKLKGNKALYEWAHQDKKI